MERVGSLGLDVHITELDVALPPDGEWDATEELRQARSLWLAWLRACHLCLRGRAPATCACAAACQPPLRRAERCPRVQVMEKLYAGPFVAEIVEGTIPAWALSSLTFILAALMAFATGTSWGTMAILFPIVIPVAAMHAGAPGFEPILLGTSSAVLAGAVFGDHCSPISDTTVLSSIASASDHVDHTRTQAPYAIACGVASIVFGYIPYGLGAPAWVLVPAGVAALAIFLRVVGRPTEP